MDSAASVQVNWTAIERVDASVQADSRAVIIENLQNQIENRQCDAIGCTKAFFRVHVAFQRSVKGGLFSKKEPPGIALSVCTNSENAGEPISEANGKESRRAWASPCWQVLQPAN
jgi:hypothetical protein